MEAGHYRKFGILWELPALSSSPLISDGTGSGSANGLGRADFSTWCRRFVRANIAHRSAILRDIQLPLEAYSALLNTPPLEKWTGSTAIQDSMDAAQQGFASGGMVQAVLEELGIVTLTKPDRRESLGSIGMSSATSADNWDRPSISWTSGSDKPGSSAEDAPDTAVDANTMSSADKTSNIDNTNDSTMDVSKQHGTAKRAASPDIVEEMAATEAEQRELSRYFPAVPKGAIFCVGCATYGHRVSFCPLRTCRICDGSIDNHGLFGCPALSPMDVVFRKIAPLKTAAAKKGKNKNRKGKGKKDKEVEEEEWVPEPDRPAQKCKLCLEVTAHRDVCPMLWTTFVPNPFLSRKTGQISASCYFCGSVGHFGGDCSKNAGEHLSGRQFSLPDDIWCQKYAEKCMGGRKLDIKEASKSSAVTGAHAANYSGQPANAKRAKTSAGETPSAAGQTKAAGQPAAAPTLSKAQTKKANRRQRLADEARGVLAKQTAHASKASQAHAALQAALPTRAGPPPHAPKGPKLALKPAQPAVQNGNAAPEQVPTETPAASASKDPMAIRGFAGTGRSAPVPASKVYNLRLQKPPLQPMPAQQKPVQKKPAQQKPAQAKQSQEEKLQVKKRKAKRPQPNQPQPKQPNQPAKITRKQRKQAAVAASTRANAQGQKATQSTPGQSPDTSTNPGRQRRGTAALE